MCLDPRCVWQHLINRTHWGGDKTEHLSKQYEGIISLDRLEYEGTGMIHCISVSENGQFAIAYADTQSVKHIVLYDLEGDVLFHLRLKEAGSIRLAFDISDDSFSIYLVRSKTQLVVDHNGELADVFFLNEIPKVIFDTNS